MQFPDPKAMEVDPAKARWCVFCRWFNNQTACESCLDGDIRSRPMWTLKPEYKINNWGPGIAEQLADLNKELQDVSGRGRM